MYRFQALHEYIKILYIVSCILGSERYRWNITDVFVLFYNFVKLNKYFLCEWLTRPSSKRRGQEFCKNTGKKSRSRSRPSGAGGGKKQNKITLVLINSPFLFQSPVLNEPGSKRTKLSEHFNTGESGNQLFDRVWRLQN